MLASVIVGLMMLEVVANTESSLVLDAKLAIEGLFSLYLPLDVVGLFDLRAGFELEDTAKPVAFRKRPVELPNSDELLWLPVT